MPFDLYHQSQPRPAPPSADAVALVPSLMSNLRKLQAGGKVRGLCAAAARMVEHAAGALLRSAAPSQAPLPPLQDAGRHGQRNRP